MYKINMIVFFHIFFYWCYLFPYIRRNQGIRLLSCDLVFQVFNSLWDIKIAAFPVFLQFIHWFPQQMEFGSVVLPILASRLGSRDDFIHLWELLSIIKKRNWNCWRCCSSAVFEVKVLPLLTFCRCVSTHSSGFCRFNLFFPPCFYCCAVKFNCGADFSLCESSINFMVGF